MSFQYTQKARAGKAYAEITGYEGEVRYLQIPPVLDGLPVRSIGGHAFSGRTDIREAQVPESVERLGPFCFYDCENLRKICLTDSVSDYYDGVIRSCGRLAEIEIHINSGKYRVIRDMADDVREEMHFHLWLRDTELRLTFPPYHDEDREDTMARAIHPKIVGAGYAYRQTVTREEIHFREYDSLFPKAEADGWQIAARVALDRLMYPVDLADADREQYADWLSRNAEPVLGGLIERNDPQMLEGFLDAAEVPSGVLDAAVARTSREGKTELTGLLMEYGRHRFSTGSGPETFAL